MNRLAAVLLAVCLMLSLVGCTPDKGSDQGSQSYTVPALQTNAEPAKEQIPQSEKAEIAVTSERTKPDDATIEEEREDSDEDIPILVGSESEDSQEYAGNASHAATDMDSEEDLNLESSQDNNGADEAVIVVDGQPVIG